MSAFSLVSKIQKSLSSLEKPDHVPSPRMIATQRSALAPDLARRQALQRPGKLGRSLCVAGAIGCGQLRKSSYQEIATGFSGRARPLSEL